MQIKELSEAEYQKESSNLDLNPLQSVQWGRLKSDGWVPIYIKCSDSDKSFNSLILQKRIPLLNKNFGYIPRLFYKVDSDILNSIADYFRNKNFSHLLIDPDVDYSKIIQNEKQELDKLAQIMEKSPFEKAGIQIQPSRTVVLDLSKSEDVLFNEMRSKHRQYIRKAEKKGIKVVEGSASDMDSFCKIMRDIAKERNYLLHSCDYYKKVYRIFSENDLAKLFLAKKNDEIVGAYLIIFNRDSAYEMYGGCKEKGNKLLANYLLKWTTIKYSKSIGKKFYDQWGAEFKYPGLVQFKEGFGGHVVNFPAQYVYVYDQIAFKAYKIFEKLNIARQKLGI